MNEDAWPTGGGGAVVPKEKLKEKTVNEKSMLQYGVGRGGKGE
jgi:hypothetical protein